MSITQRVQVRLIIQFDNLIKLVANFIKLKLNNILCSSNGQLLEEYGMSMIVPIKIPSIALK